VISAYVRFAISSHLQIDSKSVIQAANQLADRANHPAHSPPLETESLAGRLK